MSPRTPKMQNTAGQMKITAFLGGSKASPTTKTTAAPRTATDDENEDPMVVELPSERSETNEAPVQRKTITLVDSDSDDEAVRHSGHRIPPTRLEDSTEEDSNGSDLVVLQQKPKIINKTPSKNTVKRKTTPKRAKPASKVTDGIIGMKVRSPDNSAIGDDDDDDDST